MVFSHIKEIVSKAYRALGIIRNTFKKVYISTRTFYMILVRPYLDYTSSVWNLNVKKDIEGVQKTAKGYKAGQRT